MISNLTVKKVYTGNGATKVWPIPFAYTDKSQILALITANGAETEITDFTIDTNANTLLYPKTGSALTAGTTITIYRSTDLTQQADMKNQGGAWPTTIEAGLDKLTQMVQEVKEGVARAVKVPMSSAADPDTLLAALNTNASQAATAAATATENARIANEAAKEATSVLGGATTALYESTGAGVISGFDGSVAGSVVNIKTGITHMPSGFRGETADLSITPNAADPTNPRIDLIYISHAGIVTYLAGTASPSPIMPAVPDGCLGLYSVGIYQNGTLVLTDLRVIKARYQNMGMVSVKDFENVRGDGTTDDTAAIQRAIDYCATKSLPLRFPKGAYRVTQIVLRNGGRYYFEQGSIIIKSANVSAVVNESIDKFGSIGTYKDTESLLTADSVPGAMDTMYIEGLTLQTATSDYQTLPYAQQILYKGSGWLSGPQNVDDFPVNLVGLKDSIIKNVNIVDIEWNASVNLGFCLRTTISDCTLHQGADGCLQVFACVQCRANFNNFKNGGGGMLALQASDRCLAHGNTFNYDATLSFTPANYQCLAVKGSHNSVITGNVIDGKSVPYSQGITVAQQDAESHGNVIVNNIIKDCDLGICVDSPSTTTTIITGNTLTGCGKSSNKGSISLIGGQGVVVKGNTIRYSISHNIWINSGVNFVNIKDNLFEETAPYMSMILFYDKNTSTTSYNIRDNVMRNITPDANVRGIMFATGASPLYNDRRISGNVFSGIGDTLRLSTTKTGDSIFQQIDRFTTVPLAIRCLATPTIFDPSPFVVTRNSVGTYTIALGASVPGSLFKVLSVQASYKMGYNPGDFKGCRTSIVYNDYGNVNRSVNEVVITLADTNGVLTDNPTTNGNAANLYNFGLDLLITYQIDPSGI